MGRNVATVTDKAPQKRRAIVKRKEGGVAQANRAELDSVLAMETQAGKRLESVTIKDGALTLAGTDEAQQYVGEAFGSKSREFQTYCIAQLIAILPEPASKETNDYTLPMNSAVAMLAAIAPQNELEAMLAVQMVATSHLALKTMRLTGCATEANNRTLNGNLATKFSRTFTTQMEALNRHRRGGKQIVEHVHVNAGGQAVIAGTVNHGAGAGGE